MRTTSGTLRSHRTRRLDHALGDRVALHDAAEDVDQDRLETRVAQHQLEGLGDLFCRGAAADVEEVRRLAAEELDRVHRRHRQPGAVDEAADVAVELDVAEVELARLDLGRILLVEVAQFHDLGMAEQCVGIEVELGVQRDDAAVLRQDQRIDLGKRGIRVPERLVQPLQHGARLRNARGRDADLGGDIVGVMVRHAECRIDVHLVDLLRRMGGDLLDVHAAFARRHQGHALGGAIDHHADVKLLGDVGALLDQQAAHLLATRPRLVRDQLHAENFRSALLHLVDRAGELHAAALAAATRVDLRLHHPDRAPERLGRLDRLVDGERRYSARNRNAEAPEHVLALVFVDLHCVVPSLIGVGLVCATPFRFG